MISGRRKRRGEETQEVGWRTKEERGKEVRGKVVQEE